MFAKTEKVLDERLSGKCQFVIPVFQRNYDWRKKECERLFNDIIDLAEDKEHPNRKHFIGALVWQHAEYKDNSYNQFILIDGQQRLTSITLLLKALYDYLGDFGDQYQELRTEIQETYLINRFTHDSKLKLKLKPNKVDNENFNKLMQEQKQEIDNESAIGRNYTEFKKMISQMNVSAKDFLKAMQRIEAVTVDLDASDNPQVIFESLNATGVDLSDIDLIRNYLLMGCTAENQTQLYENYWLKIEQLLGDVFLQFIRDYLSLENKDIPRNNEVYQTFKKFYIKKNYEKEFFLQDLLQKATIYNRLYVFPNDTKPLTKALRAFCEDGKKTTTYPFIFGLLMDNTPDENGIQKIDDEALCKIVRLLESYWIRRNVCNLAGGGVSQLMASLYNILKEKYEDRFYNNTFDKVSLYLAGITTKPYFPKDEQFRREFTTRNMFSNTNKKYILRVLEESTQSKEIIDFDRLTVEHIMPQTLSNEWKKYLNRPDYDSFHAEYVHRIGNLTLTAYNTEMSNKLFDEKKAHIDFSRLTLNKYFENIDSWKDEKAIDDRSNHLADIAIKLWPYPDVKNIEKAAKESRFLLDDDQYDYTGTTPVGIEINGEDLLYSSWSILFGETIRYLYEQDSDHLITLLKKETSILAEVQNDLRQPFKIAEGYYVETGNPTNSKMKILSKLFTDFRYEPDEIIIHIK